MAIVSREMFSRHLTRRYCEIEADWLEDGAKLRVQSLTERERNAIEQKLDDKVSARARLIIAAVVDQDGHRIFDDSHAEMIETLDASVVAGVVNVISDHCDMHGNRAKAITDTAKN